MSGATSLQIANAGGLGAQTTGNGIEVVSAINGGTTTATTTKDGFALAGGHVDAGAFQYRLYASNAAGTSQSWFLRTQATSAPPPSDQTEVPPPPPPPPPPPSDQTDVPPPPPPPPPPTGPTTYRVEVPLLAALPNFLRSGDLTMLGTYHKRMGDEDGPVAQGFTAPGRLWGRVIVDGVRFQQGGDVRPDTDGHVHGLQMGVDLFRFGSAGGHQNIGVYFGYTDGKANVRGFASGLEDQYAGKLDPKTEYAGFYWTYLTNSGLYFDTVVQRSWYGGHATASNDDRIGIDGTGIIASLETGYSLALSPTWTLEPQAQIIAQGVSINDTAIPNATVVQSSRGNLTGRLGVRVKGRFDTNGGMVQPYVRANLWRGFASTDRTIFVTPATSTVLRTPTSSLWGEIGAGLTWTLRPGLSLYGEGDHRFGLDNGQGVIGHSTSGSIGIKVGL